LAEEGQRDDEMPYGDDAKYNPLVGKQVDDGKWQTKAAVSVD
jgi:hypothetical protein